MKLLDLALKLRAHPPLGYAVSLLLFLLAFLLHWSITQNGFPFITFMPSVLLATLLGRWQGILNAVLSGLAAWYFFLPPHNSFEAIWPMTYVALGLYAITVAIIISVAETMFAAIDDYRAEKIRTATMFHELQHRIANNLQFIGSMLSVTRRKVIKTPEMAAGLLDEASQRLTIMARIHRRLYDPAEANIEFRKLIEEVSADLIEAVGASNVTCIVDMPPIGWNPDRLITLALLVTELITNALKHAFGEVGGTVTITLTQTAPHEMELTIVDNGRGLPEGFTLASTRTLGMQIIQGLVRQMGGTLEITSDASAAIKGTTAKVLLRT